MSTVTSVTSNTWSADCISVKGLNLYAGEAPPRLLLRDAAFTITKHDRVVVLGRNGVGKSTLFAWLGLASKSSTTTKTWSVYEVAQELEPSAASVVNVVLSAHRLRGRLWERQAWLEDPAVLLGVDPVEFLPLTCAPWLPAPLRECRAV